MSRPTPPSGRRASALLSSYYDVGDERDGDAATTTTRRQRQGRQHVSESINGSTNPTTSTSTDLDAATFKVDDYVTSMLQDLDAGGLHDVYASLAAELKRIESQSQMLVYDNYGKFIQAATAASALKRCAGEMSTMLDELKVRAGKASALSEETHARLGARREVVEQLRGARGLIGRLSSSLASVRALEELVDDGESVNRSVKGVDAKRVIMDYVEAREVLEAVGGRAETSSKAFAMARERGERSVGEVVEKLKVHARSSTMRVKDDVGAAVGSGTDSQEAPFGLSGQDCLELLSALDVSQDELVEDFMLARKRILTRVIETSREAYFVEDESSRMNLKDFISSLNQAFLAEFDEASASFSTLFPNAEKSRDFFVRFTKESFAEYFAFVREVCSPHVEKTDIIDASKSMLNVKQLMCAMGSMAADLAAIHRSIPEARLGDRAMETIEKSVRSRVNAAFVCLERDLLTALNAASDAAKTVSTVKSSQSDDKLLLQRFIALSDALLTGVHALLGDVESLMDERPILISSWREEFASMVHGHFVGLVHSTVARLVVGSPISPKPVPNPPPLRTPLTVATAEALASDVPPPPSFILVCMRLCSFLHSSATVHIAESLAKMFPASAATGAGFDLEETKKMCKSASDVLLMCYVEQSAQRIGFMIRKSLTAVDWNKAREPREPRPLADYISGDLAVIECECSQILDIGELEAPATSGVGALSSILSTQSSVMCAVIKRVLKTYAECVRCQTFPNKFAFQQVSLDVRYLEEHVLAKYMPSGQFAADTNERNVISTLAEELRSAIRARARDPSPMEKAVADRILTKA